MLASSIICSCGLFSTLQIFMPASCLTYRSPVYTRPSKGKACGLQQINEIVNAHLHDVVVSTAGLTKLVLTWATSHSAAPDKSTRRLSQHSQLTVAHQEL